MSNTATAGAVTQPLRALEQANRVRLARAELKRRVAAEKTAAAEVVVSCPWEAASMSVGEPLRSQRRWGAARCRRVLTPLALTDTKPIGSLTERQRTVLAAVLRAGTVEGAGGPAPDAGLSGAVAAR